jgi:hypothetical protein
MFLSQSSLYVTLKSFFENSFSFLTNDVSKLTFFCTQNSNPANFISVNVIFKKYAVCKLLISIYDICQNQNFRF